MKISPKLVQFAEDARALTLERREAERIQQEKDAAAAAAAATAKTKAEEQAAAEAKRQAELTAAKEAQMKAEAEGKQAAEKAKTEAAKEEAERARAATAALRAQLLQQLNSVLQTTDSPRGLVVNMADVLFDFAKYDLKTDAKIKLAKLGGIIQAHPVWSAKTLFNSLPDPCNIVTTRVGWLMRFGFLPLNVADFKGVQTGQSFGEAFP